MMATVSAHMWWYLVVFEASYSRVRFYGRSSLYFTGVQLSRPGSTCRLPYQGERRAPRVACSRTSTELSSTGPSSLVRIAHAGTTVSSFRREICPPLARLPNPCHRHLLRAHQQCLTCLRNPRRPPR